MDDVVGMFSKRRAVGGLISMIGIIAVFGIASAAFIELNSLQASFVNTSITVNKLVTEKNNERINFTIIRTPFENGNKNYTINSTNIGSVKSTINSYILVDADSVNNTNYLDSITATPGKNFTQFNVTLSGTPTSFPDGAENIIIFLTDFGKKCTVPGDVSFRVC